MQRLLAAVLVLSACAPVAPLARASEPGATLTSTPSLAPSPTASVVASPAPQPTPDPTAEPTTAPTEAPRPAPSEPAAAGPVRNDGKAIVADISATHGTRQLYYGESGNVAIVTQGGSYELNGTPLTGGTVRCTDTVRPGDLPTICVAVRILPTFALVGGRTYTLTFVGETVGSFVATGIAAAVPHAVSASATQHSLTVHFDRPMSHVAECGGDASDLYVNGTIEHLFAATGPVFPPELGAYTTADPLYRAAMRFMGRASLDDGCRAVTFTSNVGAAAGSYVVRIAGVEDEDGNPMQPASFRVTVADEGPPSLVSAQLELQTADQRIVRVGYSEAMDEATATDPERYRVSGQPLPDGSTVECEVADCVWVRLAMPAAAFSYGEELTITVVGVTDTSGNAMVPDAATSRPFKVY